MTAHQITQPALEDYPFISIVFHGDSTGFKTAEGFDVAGDPRQRSKIIETHFGWAGDITVEQLAPYEAMTDETFAGLASILSIKCENQEIKERSALQYSAYKDSHYYIPDDQNRGPYSPTQLEAYLLARATFSKNIHWGDLVSFFNQSAEDQQQAISQYFEKYHGFDLEPLLASKAKAFELPESLQMPVETKTHKGCNYHYSEVLQKWLREDRYHQQYRVDIVSDVYRTLIATAPTLSQALAKAIKHFEENKYPIDFEHCEILQGGLRIAMATFESRGHDIALSDYNPRLVKPVWLLDDLGAEKEITEKKTELCLTDEQVEAMTKYTTPIIKNDFIRTLFAVEKAVGVQWSKVKHLEDALGL